MSRSAKLSDEMIMITYSVVLLRERTMANVTCVGVVKVVLFFWCPFGYSSLIMPEFVLVRWAGFQWKRLPRLLLDKSLVHSSFRQDSQRRKKSRKRCGCLAWLSKIMYRLVNMLLPFPSRSGNRCILPRVPFDAFKNRFLIWHVDTLRSMNVTISGVFSVVHCRVHSDVSTFCIRRFYRYAAWNRSITGLNS